jgi:hypothetical protein
MLGRVVIGMATLGVAASACAPPQAQLIPPLVLRVDGSFQCNESAGPGDADRCVFWRTAGGQVFYGPFSMVVLPPIGTDEIIPPPVSEIPANQP